jgi:aspartate carbamoyltransferase catalytic subunit
VNNAKILDIGDLSREELMETLRLLGSIRDNTNMFRSDCTGKSLITLFSEYDRNCESAFSAAMVRLGGASSNFPINQGESLKDNVLTASSRGDIIAVSHPLKGAALAASLYSTVPIINAGDTAFSLPCKALRDMATIWYEKNHISNMKIGFCGNIFKSPEVYALVKCLSVYNGNSFSFCNVQSGEIPQKIETDLLTNGKKYEIVNSLGDMIEDLDVLYMTRVGSEEFSSDTEYSKALTRCILDERLLLAAKPDLSVLHPFPRGEELPSYVDLDEKAKYFSQLEYDVYAIMTFIFKMFKGRAGRTIKPDDLRSTHGLFCGNSECITSSEEYLPGLFFERGDDVVCSYCKNTVEK